MINNYKWPLNKDCLNLFDKVKISSKILNPNFQFTQGLYVKRFEELFAKHCDVKYCTFVSSGSTANSVLAMYLKDRLDFKSGDKVCFPSTTWITSISPFVREGFSPVFCDISLENFCIDLDELEDILKKDSKIKCVFATSLLGFYPNIERLKLIEKKYDVIIMLDNCESSFSKHDNKNISSHFTSTTSTYFGHLLQSVEGGFVLTNDVEIYNYSKMCRNHGLTRSLDKEGQDKYKNSLVDKNFDFNIMGCNFRNTNINAYIGLLNLKKISKHNRNRVNCYEYFHRNIDNEKFIIPKFSKKDHIPFCLPIIPKEMKKREIIKNLLTKNGIEYRPIISGNMLRQSPFLNAEHYENFCNSELLNNNGLYIGLNPFTKLNDVKSIVDILNKV